MGLARRSKRESARVALEGEAAEIIEARIAAGRPPPEVFRAAAARQAAKALPADAWYRPDGDPTPDPVPTSPSEPAPAPTVSDDFILREVRMPLPAPTAAPSRGRRTAVPKVAADAFN